RAGRRERRLRIPLRIAGDGGRLDRNASRGRGLIGVIDGDADSLVLRRPGFRKRPGELEKFADGQGNLTIGREGRTESDSERKARGRRQKGSTTIHLITLHFCRAERPQRLSGADFMSTVTD